jgi:hypothetical protein
MSGMGRTVVAAFMLATGIHAAPVPDPVVQVDFSNPELSPPQWTLILHPDGSGHFRSPMASTTKGAMEEIEAPGIDRDIQVSKGFAAHVFDAARSHKWFGEPCESHLKVAFEGWKTFAYVGPQGQGSCTFNYSRDREIEALAESMVAVSQTILEGARLEVLLQHDRLGLDSEMDFLTQAVQDGRAQQVCAIRDILQRLAQDDSVLDRVRKRARSLLDCGST